MKTYEFTLQNKPFTRMKNGQKQIEMRLFDERRQKLEVGDIIRFKNTESQEVLTTEIIALQKFNDFNELYAHYSAEELGYLRGEEVSPFDMGQYYNPAQIERFGTPAIRIKVLSSEIS